MNDKVMAVIDNEYYVDDRELQSLIDFSNAYIYGGRDHATWEKENGLLKSFKNLLETLHYCEDEEELENAIPNCFNIKVSEEDCRKIRNATDDEKDFIRVCLEVYCGIPYKAVPIRGCCQGDYATLFVPETESQDIIDLIEAMYFGTGVGIYYAFCSDSCSTPQEVLSLWEGNFYTYKWRVDDIKALIAENANCEKDDIELYEISGYTKTPIFRRADQ